MKRKIQEKIKKIVDNPDDITESKKAMKQKIQSIIKKDDERKGKKKINKKTKKKIKQTMKEDRNPIFKDVDIAKANKKRMVKKIEKILKEENDAQNEKIKTVIEEDREMVIAKKQMKKDLEKIVEESSEKDIEDMKKKITKKMEIAILIDPSQEEEDLADKIDNIIEGDTGQKKTLKKKMKKAIIKTKTKAIQNRNNNYNLQKINSILATIQFSEEDKQKKQITELKILNKDIYKKVKKMLQKDSNDLETYLSTIIEKNNKIMEENNKKILKLLKKLLSMIDTKNTGAIQQTHQQIIRLDRNLLTKIVDIQASELNDLITNYEKKTNNQQLIESSMTTLRAYMVKNDNFANQQKLDKIIKIIYKKILNKETQFLSMNNMIRQILSTMDDENKEHNLYTITYKNRKANNKIFTLEIPQMFPLSEHNQSGTTISVIATKLKKTYKIIKEITDQWLKEQYMEYKEKENTRDFILNMAKITLIEIYMLENIDK